MRGIGWIASAFALVTAVVLPRLAEADTMDPALERLVLNKACRTSSAQGGVVINPASGFTSKCTADNGAFASLIAQYGAAIAPTAMHSARTTGYGGFELAVEGAYTKIDSNAPYWEKGTEGPQNATDQKFSLKNLSPPGMLQTYTLKVRKGFPFGLEITGNVGYLAQSTLVFGGADVRMSVFEGFRTGIPAVFPELALGGSVRTVTGTEEFQLTVASFDAELSKPIPIAGSVVITPYGGYQFIRIFGDSGLIDLTPNTDAVNSCGFQGIKTPANTKKNPDGSNICAPGGDNGADFNNVTVFDPVRLSRHRLKFGLEFRFQMVMFGVQFLTDVVDVASANKGAPIDPATGKNEFADVKQQFTLGFDLGAIF